MSRVRFRDAGLRVGGWGEGEGERELEKVIRREGEGERREGRRGGRGDGGEEEENFFCILFISYFHF